MKNQTWLITGAAGYLGSYIVERLLSAGEQVVGIDDLSCGREEYLRAFEGKAFAFERVDIRDEPCVRTVVERHRPQTIIHAAALHFIPAAVADPARAVSINVLGTQVMLSAARAGDVSTFWFASTGDVYAPSPDPHREDSRIGPFNIYGLTKLFGEQLVALESKMRPSARFIIGRLFNLYGPRETNPHFLPEVLAQLKQDRTRTLRLGNLWPRRDLVPVADAARAVVETCQAAASGLTTVNIATGVAVSMQQVIDEIARLMGGSFSVAIDPGKARAVERDHLQADVTRLRALIGWTPSSALTERLRELLVYEGLLSSD